MSLKMLPTLVQLGCGPSAKPGHWMDYDGSWNARLNSLPKIVRGIIRWMYRLTGRRAQIFPSHVRYLNLHRSLPFQSCTIDAIYASHVWEHLYYADASYASGECFRVLKPGGRIRLVVPNLRLYCEKYIAQKGTSSAAYQLHESLMYRALKRDENVVSRTYNALTEFHTHKFMYDEAAMVELLTKAGFIDLKVCGYLESELPYLSEIESPGRLYDQGFAVEGLKG